jgi:TRAP-type C4-dicarboxylate transport system permease small subunit
MTRPRARPPRYDAAGDGETDQPQWTGQGSLPQMIRRLLDALYLGAGYLAGLFLIAIFLMMMALSLGRELGINVKSGDDIASWCMAALAFLGLAHTFKSGEMIRVGLLTDRLTGRTKWLTELFALTLAALFIGFFAWHAVDLTVTSWRINDMSTGVLVVPLWIPQIGFTSGLVILFIAIADELVRVIGGNRPSYQKEPPRTADEVIERAASSGV